MSTKNIYIILTDTGTLLSRMIKLYTKDELNHVSISFDDQLSEVYSFGRKDQRNPFIGGFVRENINERLLGLREKRIECAVYCCEVDNRTYNRIREQISIMEQHRNDYTYNLLGLFAVAFNMRMDRAKAFFCSQFVSFLFQRAGASIVNKPPSLVTPGDIAKSSQLQHVYKGCLFNYLSSKTKVEMSERTA